MKRIIFEDASKFDLFVEAQVHEFLAEALERRPPSLDCKRGIKRQKLLTYKVVSWMSGWL